MKSNVVRATICLGVTQLIGWGTILGPIPILASSISKDLNISLETVFLGVTVMMVIGAFSGWHLGKLVDQFGGRWPMVVGAVVASIGLASLGLASSKYVFWLAWTILGFSLPLVLSNSCYPALAQLAGDSARQAVSCITLFSGISITIFYPLIYYLELWLSWRATLLIFSALHIAISIPIFILILNNKSRTENIGAARKAASHPQIHGKGRKLAFLVLILIFGLHAFISTGIWLNIINIYERVGLETQLAVFAMAFSGALQMAVRLIEILASRRYPAIVTLLLSSILQMLALLLALAAQTPAWLAAFVVGCALSNGLMAIARASVPLVLFGSRSYGAVMGRLAFPFSLMSALAPLCFVHLITTLGPLTALYIAAVLSVISVVFCVTIFEIWRNRSRKIGQS